MENNSSTPLNMRIQNLLVDLLLSRVHTASLLNSFDHLTMFADNRFRDVNEGGLDIGKLGDILRENHHRTYTTESSSVVNYVHIRQYSSSAVIHLSQIYPKNPDIFVYERLAAEFEGVQIVVGDAPVLGQGIRSPINLSEIVTPVMISKALKRQSYDDSL